MLIVLSLDLSEVFHYHFNEGRPITYQPRDFPGGPVAKISSSNAGMQV